jgi:hypothetical protein
MLASVNGDTADTFLRGNLNVRSNLRTNADNIRTSDAAKLELYYDTAQLNLKTTDNALTQGPSVTFENAGGELNWEMKRVPVSADSDESYLAFRGGAITTELPDVLFLAKDSVTAHQDLVAEKTLSERA